MASECKEELRQCALEIMPDDPHLFDSYEGFERVMWVEDYHMKEHGLTRAGYEQILRDVYRDLKPVDRGGK